MIMGMIVAADLRLLSSDLAIYLGADVGHPGPGVLKPSVASLVWSYDLYASKYMATTSLQSPHQEIITDLRSMVSAAIGRYGDASKAAPRKIVFFRDGVSEGEFETVRAFEIQAIKGDHINLNFE